MFAYEILELIAKYVWITFRKDFIQMYIPGPMGDHIRTRPLITQLVELELTQSVQVIVKRSGVSDPSGWCVIPMEGSLYYYCKKVMREKQEPVTHFVRIIFRFYGERLVSLVYREHYTYGYYRELYQQRKCFYTSPNIPWLPQFSGQGYQTIYQAMLE